MALPRLATALLSVAVSVCLSAPLAAQSLDKVKSDVLSALSTPLPITVVGPLLTGDVSVTREGDGFRAVLADTTLMGLLPFGDVSFHLDAEGDDTYHVTDLQLPETLDFPTIGTLTFSGMTFDGTWSTRARSYSSLTWKTRDLSFRPDTGGPQNDSQGPAASLSIGSLAFDVLKQPDDGTTGSRFAITAQQVAALGLGPQDVRLAEVKAALSATGEKPVDLYSVLRQVMMLGAVRDGGARMQALGQSLLGNTYDSVTLALGAKGVDAAARGPRDSYFKAGDMHITAALKDVEPRTWGAADLVVRLGDVDQKDFLPESTLHLKDATVRISGGNLAVADMMRAITTLAHPPRHRPVEASALVDGLMGFGKLEVATEGKALRLEAFKPKYRDGKRVKARMFATAFDGWNLDLGVSGLDNDEGEASFKAALAGGQFTPGQDAPPEIMRHVNAWFPKELSLQSSMTDLNEGLLKRMLKGVQIRDLHEPVEILLPLALYAASTVPDVSSGKNVYETALFRIEQEGTYRFFPTEIMSMIPYEGETTLSMTGLPALLGYLGETGAEFRPGSDEATALGAVRAGLVVMRNLADKGADGALDWTIARPDVTRREITLNGVTLRYPDLLQYLPMLGALTIGLPLR